MDKSTKVFEDWWESRDQAFDTYSLCRQAFHLGESVEATKGNGIRTRVLLEKAYRVLKDIEELMNSGEDFSDPYVECPFCMGELFEKEDLELIEFIKKHLEGK